MQIDKIKTIAASVTLVGAAALLYFSLGEKPAQVEPGPPMALGQIMAEEAAKLTSAGGRLILITLDNSMSRNPTAELQMKGFFTGLRDANLTAALTNAIRLDPLRLVRVPPAGFFEILKKQSENDVIVSFLGPPVLTPEQRAKIADKKLRILALCSGAMPRQIDLKELFAQSLLHVAIISRSGQSPSPSSPDATPRDSFDRLFQVVTSANLSELPPPANNMARSQ